MSFDPLVANAGRLQILTALAVEERQEFVHLRRRTQLTDGNLAAHARRLQSAGLIEIDKSFRANKPVTSYRLTADGRRALEAHARRLVAAISHRRLPSTPDDHPPTTDPFRTRRAPAGQSEPTPNRPATVPSLPDTPPEPADDWVD
jgi:DNA-binding MarR family transcriptional regulator